MQHHLTTLSTPSICRGSESEPRFNPEEVQEVERVYNKVKRAFHNRRHDVTLVNEAIDHAIAVVNSIAVIAATSTLAAEPDSELKLKMYTWLVSRASIWRNPIMRDYVSIRYLTKQVAKHIDLMYSISISTLSRPDADAGAILFTETDRRTYLDMLEEYRQIIMSL
jgi:hypothetical protein